MRTDFNLEDIRVAVTGGTSGLGVALVRLLAAKQARTAFVARTAASVERVAHETGAHGVVGDVGRKEDIYPIALQIAGNLGGLDVLINNASSLGPVPLVLLADTECEELEEALCVNVLGAFRLTKALFGALAASARERRGALVINIVSDAAVNAYPGWGAYGASKAALRHLTAIWDEETKAQGIRFLAIDPGDMDTPLHALALPEADRSTLNVPSEIGRGDHRADDGEVADAKCRSGSMMTAGSHPDLRPARLLMVAPDGGMAHFPRSALAGFIQAGAVVVANDAATLPASLGGMHAASGAPIEIRLAGWVSLGDPSRFVAVAFGRGDHRMRTEDRPLPPPLAPGDHLSLGPLAAIIEEIHDHPRLVSLRFAGSRGAILAGLAAHGRPIQYAHVAEPLALWDVWTRIAAAPLAFEPPSAGFALDWQMLSAWRSRGVHFATLTHAAGISSTGDAVLDHRLPFDEPFHIPRGTALAIAQAKSEGHRVIAIGTTVVRALETAATADDGVRAGNGIAHGRIGEGTSLRLVDAVLTGVHERGESHFELLSAFAPDQVLDLISQDLARHRYRRHEFGDSLLLHRQPRSALNS